MGTLFLTKEARIYTGEKTASSVSGAGKTGKLHVKKMHLWIPYFLQRRQEYIIGQRATSINGDGKTGQLHVKE